MLKVVSESQSMGSIRLSKNPFADFLRCLPLVGNMSSLNDQEEIQVARVRVLNHPVLLNRRLV